MPQFHIAGISFAIHVQKQKKEFVASVPDCPGLEGASSPSEATAVIDTQQVLRAFIQAAYKSPHQIRVDKMMRLIAAARAALGLNTEGQAVPRRPVMLGLAGRLLRAKLVFEEACELIRGLGIQVSVGGLNVINQDHSFNEASWEPSLKEIADGCFDLRVVTTGTLSAFGMADEDGQLMVDRNNLDKFKEGHTIRSDGKLIKPPGHKPPDIEGWLKSLEAIP